MVGLMQRCEVNWGKKFGGQCTGIAEHVIKDKTNKSIAHCVCHDCFQRIESGEKFDYIDNCRFKPFLKQSTKALKGKAIINTVWVSCPKCGGDVTDENGSLAILWNGSGKLKCQNCDSEVKLPKVAKSS